ncbi:hypothetical protein D3C87_1852330 [compost metagenome]
MEQATNDIAWHADAMIFDGYFDKITFCGRRYIYYPTLITILDGIVDEVAEDFADTTAVGSDGR